MVHGGGKSSSFRGLQQEGKVSERREECLLFVLCERDEQRLPVHVDEKTIL